MVIIKLRCPRQCRDNKILIFSYRNAGHVVQQMRFWKKMLCTSVIKCSTLICTHKEMKWGFRNLLDFATCHSCFLNWVFPSYIIKKFWGETQGHIPICTGNIRKENQEVTKNIQEHAQQKQLKLLVFTTLNFTLRESWRNEKRAERLTDT